MPYFPAHKFPLANAFLDFWAAWDDAVARKINVRTNFKVSVISHYINQTIATRALNGRTNFKVSVISHYINQTIATRALNGLH